MSKEFEELKAKAEASKQRAKDRAKDGYHYARSLGFPVFMAMQLQSASKEKILRLSKELKSSSKGG